MGRERILARLVGVAFGLAVFATASAQVLAQSAADPKGRMDMGSVLQRDAQEEAGGILSSVNRVDRGFFIQLAEFDLAEIASAQQVLRSSKDPEVRRFAQQILDSHSVSLSELSDLAARKHVELPSLPSATHRKLMARMDELSAAEISTFYLAKSGVDDHRDALGLLKRITTYAEDTDLKTLAEKLVPEVEAHLGMAQTLATRSVR